MEVVPLDFEGRLEEQRPSLHVQAHRQPFACAVDWSCHHPPSILFMNIAILLPLFFREGWTRVGAGATGALRDA